jgi:hypothetical protein
MAFYYHYFFIEENLRRASALSSSLGLDVISEEDIESNRANHIEDEGSKWVENPVGKSLSVVSATSFNVSFPFFQNVSLSSERKFSLQLNGVFHIPYSYRMIIY